MQTVLGVFTDKNHADMVVSELKDMGYDPQNMSVIVRDNVYSAGDKGTGPVEGAVSGATTGGVLGGIAGLLIGLGAITVPGIGGLLIGGPLAAALGLTGAAATAVSGAATGAVAGGLVGGLTSLGLPKDAAEVYESRVREGAVLLAVPVKSGVDSKSVEDVFNKHQADQVRTIEGEETQ